MLSDVQYNELMKCYADPVTVMEKHEWGKDVLRILFVDYIPIRDIVTSSLVNRQWKQLLGNDPGILFSVCIRSKELNFGFNLKPAFFSDNLRNNSEIMLKFTQIRSNHKFTQQDWTFFWDHTGESSCFYPPSFYGDQLDKKFFIDVFEYRSDFFDKIPNEFFKDHDFVLALFNSLIINNSVGKVLVVNDIFDLFAAIVKFIPENDFSYWLTVFKKCDNLKVFECIELCFPKEDPVNLNFLAEVNRLKNNLKYPHLNHNCNSCY